MDHAASKGASRALTFDRVSGAC